MSGRQVFIVVVLCVTSAMIGFAIGLLALPYWMRVAGY
jgi:hypothetical protein